MRGRQSVKKGVWYIGGKENIEEEDNKAKAFH